MKIHGDFEVGDRVSAKEDAVRFLDVQAFDGKDISGSPQFLRKKKQRRGFLHLVRPPANHWGEQLEFQQINCDERAQDVQVRYTGMKITARGRPVQNNRFQVLTRRFFQPAHEFRQFSFHRIHLKPIGKLVRLPTAPSPAAPAGAAAKPTEAAASATPSASATGSASPTATDHGANPPAAATSTPVDVASGTSRSGHQKDHENDSQQNPNSNSASLIVLLA